MQVSKNLKIYSIPARGNRVHSTFKGNTILFNFLEALNIIVPLSKYTCRLGKFVYQRGLWVLDFG